RFPQRADGAVLLPAHVLRPVDVHTKGGTSNRAALFLCGQACTRIHHRASHRREPPPGPSHQPSPSEAPEPIPFVRESRMKRRSVVWVLPLLLVAPLSAQTRDDNWKHCADKNAEVSIGGCT